MKSTIKKAQKMQINVKEARSQLNEMDSTISVMGVKSLIYYFNKLMRWAIHGLNIDTASIKVVE